MMPPFAECSVEDENLNNMTNKIKQSIEQATGIPFDKYYSKSREREFVFCRMIFIHHCRELKITYSNIGKMLNRNHSSIIYLSNGYQDEYKFNPEFRRIADKINELIKK